MKCSTASVSCARHIAFNIKLFTFYELSRAVPIVPKPTGSQALKGSWLCKLVFRHVQMRTAVKSRNLSCVHTHGVWWLNYVSFLRREKYDIKISKICIIREYLSVIRQKSSVRLTCPLLTRSMSHPEILPYDISANLFSNVLWATLVFFGGAAETERLALSDHCVIRPLAFLPISLTNHV